MDHTVHSGACEGADLYWEEVALKNYHSVVHYVPHKKRNQIDTNRIKYIIPDRETSSIAFQKCKSANKKLKRSFPCRNPYATELLERNYSQIAKTDSCYAVGFYNETEKFPILGGTAWACCMFIDKVLEKDITKPICLYFYDQTKKQWLQPYFGNGQIKWRAMEHLPPKPSGHYTGIGTRELSENGKQAIISVYNQ